MGVRLDTVGSAFLKPWARISVISYISSRADMRLAPRPSTMVCSSASEEATRTSYAIGLPYGKSLAASCEIGTRLASSVIATKESVCPRFRPEEFGLTEIPES